MVEDCDVVAVIQVQPILRAEPEQTAVVLQDGVDRLLRETVLDQQVAESYVQPQDNSRSTKGLEVLLPSSLTEARSWRTSTP